MTLLVTDPQKATPWHLDAEAALIGNQRGWLIADTHGNYVAYVINGDVRARAEFIVRAVNAHEALVHALTFAQLILEERIASDCDFCGGQGGSEGDGSDFRLTPVRHRAGCEYLTVAAALALAEGSRP